MTIIVTIAMRQHGPQKPEPRENALEIKQAVEGLLKRTYGAIYDVKVSAEIC